MIHYKRARDITLETGVNRGAKNTTLKIRICAITYLRGITVNRMEIGKLQPQSRDQMFSVPRNEKEKKRNYATQDIHFFSPSRSPVRKKNRVAPRHPPPFDFTSAPALSPATTEIRSLSPSPTARPGNRSGWHYRAPPPPLLPFVPRACETTQNNCHTTDA